MSTTRPDAFADLWCVILFYIGHLFTPKGMMKMYQSQKSYHRCGRGGQQLECEDGMPWQSKVYRSLDVPVCKKTSAPEIIFSSDPKQKAFSGLYRCVPCQDKGSEQDNT